MTNTGMSNTPKAFPEATFDGIPVMMHLCGFHSRTKGAQLWIASGGSIYTGPDCDVDGCNGEVKS